MDVLEEGEIPTCCCDNELQSVDVEFKPVKYDRCDRRLQQMLQDVDRVPL